MLIHSDTTQRTFEAEDAVYYRNVVQSAWMLSHTDCELLDIFESDGKLVCAFSKESHKKYIQEWHNRPHESKI